MIRIRYLKALDAIFAFPFFCLVLPIFAYGQGCSSDSKDWHIYDDSIMQVTFSYPGAWALIQETPDGAGGASAYLKTKGFLFCMDREFDTTKTHNKLTRWIEFERKKAMSNSHFVKDRVILGKDTCERISYVKINHTEVVRIVNIYRNLLISVYYYNYPLNRGSEYASCITKMLSSFDIRGTGLREYLNPGGCIPAAKDWRIYHSLDHTFSFSYPGCWQLLPENEEIEDRILIINGEMEMSIRKLPDFSKAGMITLISQLKQIHAGTYSDSTFTKDGDTYIRFGFKEQDNGSGPLVKKIGMYCKRSGILCRARYYTDNDSFYEPAMNAILSSISITKEGLK